jgi:hypothetical protein
MGWYRSSTTPESNGFASRSRTGTVAPSYGRVPGPWMRGMDPEQVLVDEASLDQLLSQLLAARHHQVAVVLGFKLP